MRDEHIIEMLDNTPLGNLSAAQLEAVRAHSQNCLTCEQAYQASQLSSVLIKERVQSVVEPSPFFQTRVMAALREQQALESVPAWLRLWRSTGALVSSMAVATVALAALSFVVPSVVNEQATTAFSAESVIFDQGNDEQLSYEQVLSTIYAEEDEAK